MRMRDYIEQASVRGTPDWLVRERPSRDGGAIQDEWMQRLADAKSDEGTRRLSAAMIRLRAERPTKPLLGRANAKALRWVETAANRSRLAQQLRRAAPSIGWTQKLLLSANSCAWRVAALSLLVVTKFGLFSAIDGAVRLAERVSRLHIDRHIGPMT